MVAKKNYQFFLILTMLDLLVMAGPLSNSCKLPNCRLPGISIPGSLKADKIPQMVVLTFDDGVSSKNLQDLKKLFGKEYQNPNRCPMQYTFFASDIDNDYNVSSQLISMGHELASHSLTHRLPSNYWSNISAEDYGQEMGGMKRKLSEFSNAKVSGARAPFLKLNGDASYQVFKENGFVWDSSMLVGSPRVTDDQLPIWPFTLDKPVSGNYCMKNKCPQGSYPGLWEFPLNRLYNKKGEACSLVDECEFPYTVQEIKEFFQENFYNHYYTKNRTPFGIYLHITWLQWATMMESIKSFLQEVSKLNDVYVVTVSQAIDWVRHPSQLSEISNLPSWNCHQ